MINGGMMGGLLWLFFLALIVWGVWLLIRAIRGPDTRAHTSAAGTAGTSTALSILEERYVRGEIDHEEFEERRRALRG